MKRRPRAPPLFRPGRRAARRKTSRAPRAGTLGPEPRRRRTNTGPPPPPPPRRPHRSRGAPLPRRPRAPAAHVRRTARRPRAPRRTRPVPHSRPAAAAPRAQTSRAVVTRFAGWNRPRSLDAFLSARHSPHTLRRALEAPPRPPPSLRRRPHTQPRKPRWRRQSGRVGAIRGGLAGAATSASTCV